MVRRTKDLLLQLALEHRDLAGRARALRQRWSEDPVEALRDAATGIVEHELAHRLLVHPLLRLDARGRLLFQERREEQLLLADRLRHALVVAGIVPSEEDDPLGPAAVTGLGDEFVAHTDREEILAFPHLRRLVRPDQLLELGALRGRLRGLVGARLTADRSPVSDGRWATVARRDLPDLLDLPDDLVEALPSSPSGGGGQDLVVDLPDAVSGRPLPTSPASPSTA
jgi:hypothetical protein